eukprot:TRINITY_DN3758_c0_g1_i1.p2 TRINITY_DN3758_c0_g1~~TRINITY_DN3758_c0_g1_i1.p2  ORF type:complete len:292 (+),score=92.27 TRINITY_DN3758_c0_g1_i1:126-878(+)
MAGPPATTAAAMGRPPPTYAGYLRQVASEVGPLLLTVHAVGLAVAGVANPALEAADLAPLAASAALIGATHLLPYTPSLAASAAKAATIPIGVAGLTADALVRVDRRVGSAGSAAAVRVDSVAVAATGWAVAAVGLALLVWTVGLFYTRGRGTLSPEAATQPTVLVVDGPYRVVRNPMITGVLLLLAGQGVARKSPRLAAFAAIFFAIKHTYFVLKEEPALGRRYGKEYATYMQTTPRWLPGVGAMAKAP